MFIVHVYIYIYIHVYVYIYTHRERERDIDKIYTCESDHNIIHTRPDRAVVATGFSTYASEPGVLRI